MPPPGGFVDAGRGARPIGVDPRGEVGQARRVEQAIDRHVPKRRVGDVGVAVGHRQLGRLEPQVDPARIGDAVRPEGGRRGRLEAFEDPEQLERHDTGAVGWVARDADAAVVDGDRVTPGRRVVAQVAGADRGSRSLERAHLADREVAFIEGVEAFVGEGLERPGEGRQPDQLPGSPGPTTAAEHAQQAGVRPEGRCRARCDGLDGIDEGGPGREAAARQLDGRGEDVASGQPPVAGVGIAPRAHRPGHRDAQWSPLRERRQALGAQTGGVGRGCAPARAVERVLRPARRVPDEPERVAAESAVVGDDDAQDRVRGDGRVDGRAALAEDRQAGLAGEVVRRDDRAMPAAGKGHGRPRAARGHVGTTPSSSSLRRRRASGNSATARSTIVAMSMPSTPRRSAAIPPMSAPMICPMARNTE